MKVSIIIPVYNAVKFLPDCLGSIARQTFRDFEIIAVDDGCTDDSAAVLEFFAGKLPVRILRQPNRGQSVARNSALAVARGEYVLMVDADDVIHPRLLEMAVAAVERMQGDFAVFNHRDVLPVEVKGLIDAWARDVSAADEMEIPEAGFEWFVESRRWPTPWQFLFRRSRIEGLAFIPGIVYEDVPFVLTFLSRHGRGVWLNKDLYGYVRHEASTTHADNYERRITGFETGMRSLRTVLNERRYRLFVKSDCANWLRGHWRAIRRIPAAEVRFAAESVVRRFLFRCAEDGLLRMSDFRGFWKIRFLIAVWRGRHCNES